MGTWRVQTRWVPECCTEELDTRDLLEAIRYRMIVLTSDFGTQGSRRVRNESLEKMIMSSKYSVTVS